jgi:hypothetical protein
MKIKINNSEFF